MSNLSSQLLAVDFSELGDKIFPNTETHIIEWGWFVVNDSVFSGFVVVVALLLAALIIRLTVIRHWKTVATGFQMFLEWLVAFFDKSADEMTEEYGGLMGPYTLGAAAYICCGMLIEMFGLRPAMADLGAERRRHFHHIARRLARLRAGPGDGLFLSPASRHRAGAGLAGLARVCGLARAGKPPRRAPRQCGPAIPAGRVRQDMGVF